MKRDIVRIPNIYSSFLSCEKDAEEILRKLFTSSYPHSDILKRLLVINTRDCLDNFTSEVYNKKIKEMSVKKLREDGYIKLEPKIRMPEHEEVKAYIILSFDNFFPNATNPEFRDCNVNFDILCHSDAWDIGNYRTRPLKIAGYIDGILNNTKLSGIGEFHFLGCKQIVVNEDLSGYTLSYRAIHGSDDIIPPVGE